MHVYGQIVAHGKCSVQAACKPLLALSLPLHGTEHAKTALQATQRLHLQPRTATLTLLCGRLVFVLKRTQPEAWVNNGGTDFAVQIKPPSAEDIVAKVVNAEATYTHWSLFNRFCMALEVLDAAESVGAWACCCTSSGLSAVRECTLCPVQRVS